MVPCKMFSGYCYWIALNNHNSRYCFVVSTAAKSDVFEAFKCFKVFAKNLRECKLKTLRNDKGDYMSNAMAEFTAKCGIEH